MNRIKLLILTLAAAWVAAGAQLHPDYENPRVFERNQVPPHATLMPFADVGQLPAGQRSGRHPF